MTKQEFKLLHGFDDEDMAKIESIVKIFNAKITEIFIKSP